MGFGEHGAACRLDDMLHPVFGVGCTITLLEKARKLVEQLLYLGQQGGGVHLLGSCLAGKGGIPVEN